MTNRSVISVLIAPLLCGLSLSAAAPQASKPAARQPLGLDWKDNWLTISNPDMPEKSITVLYMEAFCRPGSTNVNWWSKTLIPHETVRLADTDGGKTINLLSRVSDGVRVTHRITSTSDEVLFHVVAENPTAVESNAHWAQSCVRVGKFSGGDDLSYIKKCFVFLDGKLTRLPTEPWATDALLTSGQVYCPHDVPRTDVNPRPLSTLVPSNGLIGCYSADEKWIIATAWQPYQELFQGILSCIHSDFRIGGLKPGEKKEIRGKIYVTDGDADVLVKRYEHDFPEQVSAPKR